MEHINRFSRMAIIAFCLCVFCALFAFEGAYAQEAEEGVDSNQAIEVSAVESDSAVQQDGADQLAVLDEDAEVQADETVASRDGQTDAVTPQEESAEVKGAEGEGAEEATVAEESASAAALQNAEGVQLGTQEDYRHLYGERPVGLMVRKAVGMDRAALEEVFAEFIQENRLNLRQLDFVKRIIDYLAQNGEMLPQDVKKPAFAGLSNVAQLFKGRLDEVEHIFIKVKEITSNGTEIA